MEILSSRRAIKSAVPKTTTTRNNKSCTNNEYPQLWPSERIAPGGMFHSAKVEYSKSTADLIKLLMAESKVSMMVRKQVDYQLRNGEPLSLPKREKPKHVQENEENEELLQRSMLAKRKSLDKIKASGVYEKPKYRPPPDDVMPCEKAKKKLQEKMSGMTIDEFTVKPKRRPKNAEDDVEVTTDTIVDELLEQINERAEWLKDMEELGEGHRYRQQVRQEIADRLRRIHALRKEKN